MTPSELRDELDKVVENKIPDSLIIMGESGVGKSQIVKQVCDKHGMELYDLRWGQYAPVDVRGVPVPDHESKQTKFYPPGMLPKVGPGLIFLDEFNMATSTMMGLAQQLLLDKKFGDYVVPEGVLVWAAGNRKIDRAAVNEVPAPVKNRIAHYVVEHDLDSWVIWAFAKGIDSRIIGFLKWRPELLHKFDPNSAEDAWPSPRSWEMAHRRLSAGMKLDPVVGTCAVEFDAYQTMAKEMLSIEAIAENRGRNVAFPEEPSIKFACVSGLVQYSLKDFQTYRNCFIWLTEKAKDEPEWIQMFVMDVIHVLSKGTDKKKAAQYMQGLNDMPEASRFVKDYLAAITAARGN